jgi:excisionase family DNA binding protein
MDTAPTETAPLFLTVDEAAALLRVNRKTFYAAISANQVPGVVHLGRSIRLSRSALVTWSSGSASPALGAKQ